MKSTSFLHHFGHFLYHSYIKIGGIYIISTPAKNPPVKILHRFYIIISDFYTIPTPKSEESTPFLYHSAYNVPIDVGIQFDASGQDILYKSNLRTPCLMLYVNVQKLYHFYTVPTSYLYRFFDSYIISISLKIFMVADTISLLYHFSDFYIIAISKWTSIISILYH